MTEALLPWAIAAFGLAMLLSAWRLLVGPALIDRVLALDTLYVNALALLILLGVWIRNAIYFEAALLIALVGLVGTVAASRYLFRGGVIE